jgi:hypothetical protein
MMSPISLMRVVIILAFLLIVQTNRHIQCRDPDVQGFSRNKDRKFLIIGSEGEQGAGMGNLIIFLPAAYYFAAFTGREIVIADRSIIGEMCGIITCGFPFVGDLAKAFPDVLSATALQQAETVKAFNMIQYMENSKNITAPVIRAAGYQPASDWWVWFNTTVHCVKKITGCDLGDVPCADRHAYQRFIRGPFKAGLTEAEEKRIQGVPDHMKHAILTLPHAYAPRLDAAIHIRAQFQHFESSAQIDDPAYRKEVSDWLASAEANTTFEHLHSKLIQLVKESRTDAAKVDVQDGSLATNITAEPVYVYLASDNEDVKDTFARILVQPNEYNFDIRVMVRKSEQILRFLSFG